MRPFFARGTLLILSLAGLTTSQAQASTSATAEAANKQIVVRCLNLIFNEKRLDEARKQCFSDQYIQHNPRAPDGPDAILGLFKSFFQANPDMSISIKRAAADGDLVWVHYHSKNSPTDVGRAVVDIFRVKDGKMVEHWDVIQNVSTSSVNNNGMF